MVQRSISGYLRPPPPSHKQYDLDFIFSIFGKSFSDHFSKYTKKKLFTTRASAAPMRFEMVVNG